MYSYFSEYASSFAEMGLAINDTIKTSAINDDNYDDLILSPAHQVIVSCIWLSLKVYYLKIKLSF